MENCEKKDTEYVSPEVQVVDVIVERGFAASNEQLDEYYHDW